MSDREEEIRKTQEIIINEAVINHATAEMEYRDRARKSSKKSLIGLVLVFINVVLVIVFGLTIFRGNENNSQSSLAQMFQQWFKKEHVTFWLIALGLGLLAIGAEILKFYVMMRKTAKIKNIKLAAKTAIMGKYYDNITPLGSGGQPFQIYYMKKGGVPGAEAMYLPVASFFLNQLAFLTLCVFAFVLKSVDNSLFILNGEAMINDVAMICAYIGAAFSIFLPTLIFILSFMPKVRSKIIKICVRFSYKFKFIKNKGAATRKANKLVNQYKYSLKMLLKSPGTLIVIVFLSFVYEIAFCSIPYFVIRACGVTSVNYVVSLCMCVFTYAAISFIPTPGNSGAAEFSFYSLFSIIGTQYLYWSMVYWRFCCYFLIVIIGICIVINDTSKNIHKRRKELKELKIQTLMESDVAKDEPDKMDE